ncbi:hypothetical protein HS7_18510 [Sulfolobales archaeon HS-7]|nr:hypothetical protein HS7_18510 [Sulfolobales archaeon HS-7]
MIYSATNRYLILYKRAIYPPPRGSFAPFEHTMKINIELQSSSLLNFPIKRHLNPTVCTSTHGVLMNCRGCPPCRAIYLFNYNSVKTLFVFNLCYFSCTRMIILSLLFGIAMGLSIAAPPGPVNAIIATEAVKSKLHGTSVGLGAMTADFTFFLITLFLGRVVPSTIINYMYLIGSLLIIYICYNILHSSSSLRSRGGNYFMGLIIGLTNPFQITWWLTAGLFMIRELTITTPIGFFSGILIWIFTFPYLVNKLGQKYIFLIKLLSITVLLIFASLMFYEFSENIILPHL